MSKQTFSFEDKNGVVVVASAIRGGIDSEVEIICNDDTAVYLTPDRARAMAESLNTLAAECEDLQRRASTSVEPWDAVHLHSEGDGWKASSVPAEGAGGALGPPPEVAAGGTPEEALQALREAMRG